MHPDRRRTLAAAAHPIVLGAAALIWINDRVLAGHAPGWLTGKLSDVGWLVVAPVLVAACLAAVGVAGGRARRGGLAIAATFYVVLQVWPPLGAAFNPAHVADLGDLIVLPALAGAFVAWRGAVPTPWRRMRWASALAVPTLFGTLVADSFDDLPDSSAPCGDGMAWDTNEPLLLQLGYIVGPAHDTDSFLRGLRLTDGDGVDVPLVAAQASTGNVLVCARDGLRGDTDYTWTIGPWDDRATNEVAFEHDGLPTVRFRTLPGDGVPSANAAECAALEVPAVTGARTCAIGWENRWDTGPGDTGDTGAR